ncbi:LysR substrate-binding domain-containing protein [Kitasatospora sp. NPDC002227]|uniref:LysR family transcriptional regulator n=1 Tax=Kitasatospora sp. NPDC002227 TaxID=3154773 RepID=UPI0033306742
MDLRRLRYFVAVAEELHFGRAATRLHMSQPPLSRRIRELEEELGCPLFERAAEGVRLTSAGELLLGEARELLGAAERAEERVRETGRRRTLVVGTVAGAGLGLGPKAAQAFRRTHPDVEVHLREADISDPSAGLRSGRVDLALTRLPFDTTGLTVHPLGAEPLVAALATDDPLGGRARLTVAELGVRPWIQLPAAADPAWRRYWLGGAESATGPVVRTVRECLHAIVWQRAVGLLPAGAEEAHRADGIRFVPLDGYPPSQAVLAWPSASADATVRAFAAAVVAASAQ